MSPPSTSRSPETAKRPPARLMLHWVFFNLGLAAVLFGSAGTLRYWQAWLYLAIHLATTLATNVHLIRNDPALLERRLKRGEGGETERMQRVFQALVGPLYPGLLCVAGVNHRFGWSAVPTAATVVGQGLTAASFVLVLFVFRENTFCSSIVEVNPAQRVISTGPYRIVRHPMYTGAVLGALATPIALGSYWATVFFVPIVALIVVRLIAEEGFLRQRLPGYLEYTGKTRYRLVPGAW